MRVAGGTGFARLWGAAGVSNFGDGVYGTALPLLAATLTRDPLLVSLVSFAEWLPWLLFGLLSGALLDRWDRRRVMWTVDAARFAVVGGLAVVVLAGEASIVLLGIVGFLLGTGQTLVDTGSHSILPALVSRDPERLEQANGRLVGTQVVTQELAGPPVGGFLFSLSAWTPFAVDAVSFAAGSALVASIRGHFGPAAEDLGPGRSPHQPAHRDRRGPALAGRPPGAAGHGRHGGGRQPAGRRRRRRDGAVRPGEAGGGRGRLRPAVQRVGGRRRARAAWSRPG